MGRVEAVHDARLGREVARKQLHPALRDDPAAHARFVREVRITARLDHPGIVPVFDAGRADDGTPWYTMRLVRGRSLEDVLSGLDLGQRLALVPRFATACEAVAHAHAHGVVHRDLKPANVMLGPLGETQVVDWGLARELDDARAADAPAGAVGTLGWMSPEQRAGAPVDARADVWALGQVLRAILCGRCPPGDDLPDAAPPDLAAIARRATATSPDARYPDASALADDVAAWLAGRRVSAFTYSSWDLLKRLGTAWRAPLVVGAAALVALAVVVATGWRHTATERDRALLAEATMRDVLREDHVEDGVAALRLGDLGAAARAASDALALGDDPGARGLAAALDAFGPRPRLLSDLTLTACPRLALDPAAATLACATPDEVSLLQVEDGATLWRVPARALDIARPTSTGPVWIGTADAVQSLSATDGAVVARHTNGVQRGLARGAAQVGGTDHLRLWRPDLPDVPCTPPAMTYDAAERDGVWLVPCTDGALRVADGATVRVVTLKEEVFALVTAAWLPDGTALLGTLDGELLRVDAHTGEVISHAQSPQGPIRRMVPSPDGRLVAVAGERMPTRLLAVPGMVWVGALPDVATDLAWRDDHTLVTAGERLRTWSLDGAPQWGVFTAQAGLDGAAAGADGLVTLHDGSGDVLAVAPDGVIQTTLHWQDGVVKQGDHASGVFTAVGIFGAGVHRWDSSTWTPLPTLGELPLRFVAYDATGELLGVPWDAGVERFAADGSSRRVAEDAVYAALSIPTEGTRWLAYGDPGGLALLDGDTVQWRGASTGLAAISGDGRVVWLAERDTLSLLGADDGAMRAVFPQHGVATAIAASADGGWVAVGLLDGSIELRDGEGVLRAILAAHQERVSEIRFVDDTLLTASWDGTARRWSLAPISMPLASLRAHLATR